MNNHVTVNEYRIGTNHSSHAEKSMRNKFTFLVISKKNMQVLCAYLKNMLSIAGIFRMRGSNWC